MMPPALLHAAGVPQPARPKLQFINGSGQTIDIVWLKSDTERVPNGSVAPGKDAIISTTFGHRFEVVGRDGKAAAKHRCTSMSPPPSPRLRIRFGRGERLPLGAPAMR
jgi:hypothetical protein